MPTGQAPFILLSLLSLTETWSKGLESGIGSGSLGTYDHWRAGLGQVFKHKELSSKEFQKKYDTPWRDTQLQIYNVTSTSHNERKMLKNSLDWTTRMLWDSPELASLKEVVSASISILNPAADNRPASCVFNSLIRKAVCLVRADCMQQQTNNHTDKWNVREMMKPNENIHTQGVC